MPVYCSNKHYLEEEHPAIADIFEQLCVDVNTYPLLLIPSSADLAIIKKGVADGKKGDQASFRNATRLAMAHLSYANLMDEKFDQKEFHNNGLGQKTKIVKKSASKKRDSITFDLLSGKDFKTKAECELDPKFIPAYRPGDRYDKDPTEMIKAVGIVKSGSIATDGVSQISESKKEEVSKMIGGAYAAFKSSDQQSKLQKFEHLYSKFKQSIQSGSKNDPFAATIAGLMKWVKSKKDESGEHQSDYIRAYQLICSLSSYDTLGMYLALFQPFGHNQFIPQLLTSDHWDGAEMVANPGDYCEVFETFYDCCPDYDSSKMESIKSEACNEINDEITPIERAKKIYEIYQSYIPRMFGDDFLDSDQKAWADEFLFKSHYLFDRGCCSDKFLSCCDNIVQLARDHFRGNDYKSETLFADTDYMSKFANIDSVSKPTGTEKFIRSDFFLKHKFVSSGNCKKYISECSNPATSKMIAFSAINGGRI